MGADSQSAAAVRRVVVLIIYALAMGCVEAAAVLYLRTVVSGGAVPTQVCHVHCSSIGLLYKVEVVREAATIVMLLAVGWLAGMGFAGRLGGFIAAFGVWDLSYYLWLHVFTGWPTGLLSPDVLFLIPIPWQGPVLAPSLLALVMTVAGSWMMYRSALGRRIWADKWVWLLTGLSTLLCLASFMAGVLEAMPGGVAAALLARPGDFSWTMYGLGLAIGLLGLVRLVAISSRQLGSA